MASANRGSHYDRKQNSTESGIHLSCPVFLLLASCNGHICVVRGRTPVYFRRMATQGIVVNLTLWRLWATSQRSKIAASHPQHLKGLREMESGYLAVMPPGRFKTLQDLEENKSVSYMNTLVPLKFPRKCYLLCITPKKANWQEWARALNMLDALQVILFLGFYAQGKNLPCAKCFTHKDVHNWTIYSSIKLDAIKCSNIEKGDTSLAVQWLGLGAFTARAWVWSLVRELRPVSLVVTKKKKKD